MLNPWLYCFLYSTNLTWRDVQYLIAYSSNYDVPRSDDWVKNSAGLWGESISSGGLVSFSCFCLICFFGGHSL